MVAFCAFMESAMGDGPRVRVRGIYATALTALLLERGATIVEPSLPIQERLGVTYVEGPEEVSIFDRTDRKGIIVEGVQASVSWAKNKLAEALPDCLFRPRNGALRGPRNAASKTEAKLYSGGPQPQVISTLEPVVQGEAGNGSPRCRRLTSARS
jgi:hypothetical protein